MAWIESHQDLLDHPKILRLSRTLGVSKNEAIGVAHRFWWWALKYAEDGDLRRFNDDDLAHAVELNGRGKDFVEAMVTCGGDAASGFIDRQPYFRIHDWWDYAGKFLQSKYKHNPAKYKRISKLYKNRSRVVHRTVKEHDTLPNLTLPNQPNQNKKEAREVLEFLNEKAGKNFRLVDANINLIAARLKSGATAAQCRQIIALKCRKWKGDPKTEEWLRPSTLFGKEKFEQYIGELLIHVDDNGLS